MKTHIKELAQVRSSVETDIQTYIKESFSKLAYTMSERASNEKKADKLLDIWRDELLGQCNKHFHRMAHVLLGFHLRIE